MTHLLLILSHAIIGALVVAPLAYLHGHARGEFEGRRFRFQQAVRVRCRKLAELERDRGSL